MKKLTTLLLTLAITLGLAACGGGTTGTAGTSAPGANTSTPPDSVSPSAAVPSADGGGAKNAAEVKVALLLPGSINDAGWSSAAYSGLTEAEAQFGIETSYTESVPLTEQETTMRDYAAQGFNLIICHGDDFTDAAKVVAAEFPDVDFAVTNSTISMANAIGMDVKNEEQGYVAGYALGLLTTTNKVGFVGSMELVAQKRVESGFVDGLKASNPDAVPSIVYVGNSDDTTKAKENALALFEQGCDTIFQYAQGAGIGVVQAAAEKGVTMIVTSPSQAEMNPDHTAFAVQTDMKANIVSVIKEYIDGNFNQNLSIQGSFATDLYKINSVNNAVIPAEDMDKVQEQVDALKSGTLVLETRAIGG